MATTTNFGWETPDDTDLVKDGAAAIRTALGGVDTSFVDLKGGTTGQVLAKASNTDLDFVWSADAAGIPATIVDAKGDLIAATAADTVARLAVGTNGQVLTADSTAATGIKWATAAAGGFTSIATGTLTGSSIAINSIPSTYKQLVLMVENYLPNTDSTRFWLRVNSRSTNYYTAANTSAAANDIAFGTAQAELTLGQSNTTANGIIVAQLPNYALSEWKIIRTTGITNNITTTTNLNWRLDNTIICKDTGAISSMTLLPETGSFTSGTYTLYGVS